MRTFYRLVILNLAVLSPLGVAGLRHIVKKTAAVSTPVILIVGGALLVANFGIAWKVARQGGIPSLESSRWWSAVSSAWTGGPFFTAVLPFAIGAAIIKRDLLSTIWAVLYFFWAYSSWAQVYSAQQSRHDRIVSK